MQVKQKMSSVTETVPDVESSDVESSDVGSSDVESSDVESSDEESSDVESSDVDFSEVEFDKDDSSFGRLPDDIVSIILNKLIDLRTLSSATSLLHQPLTTLSFLKKTQKCSNLEKTQKDKNKNKKTTKENPFF